MNQLSSLLERLAPVEHISETDEKLYAIAAEEIKTNTTRPGVMAKAFSDARGDDQRASALYIRYRVVQLRNELGRELQEYIKETERAEEASRKADAKFREEQPRANAAKQQGGSWRDAEPKNSFSDSEYWILVSVAVIIFIVLTFIMASIVSPN